jgi:sugar/nucleoside kinase (ribokinase family)
MDVLASGYPSLDYIIPVSHSPEVGNTALILCDMPDELVPTMGGCGANVAVGLRRLGFTAGVAAVIGDDRRGQRYRAQLAAEGVDLRNLIVLPKTHTSFSYLFRNPAGEYQNFFYAGAADAWSDDLTLTGLESLRWGLVTVGAYEHNRQFVEQITARGIALAWQLKPDIFAYSPGTIAKFAQHSTLILMNRIEAEFVTAALGISSIEALLSPVTRCLVVTRGAAGADVLTAEGCWHVDAVPVHVVDPVGAGDGFTAGFLAGMLRGDAPLQCARWGAIVASFVVEAIGCQTRLPTWSEVEARGKEHFGQ